jgi:hypothetical protein
VEDELSGMVSQSMGTYRQREVENALNAVMKR